MSTLVLSGGQVVLGLFSLGIAIYLGIFAAKTYLNKQSDKVRGQQASDNASPLIRKYGEVDLKQHDKNIKLASMAAALAMVFIVFAWTQFTSEAVLAEFVSEPNELEMDVPVTPREKPALPPALPPPISKPSLTIQAVNEPEPIVEPQPDPQILSPTPSNYTGPTDVNSTALPVILEPEPDPEPVVEEELPFTIVEQMPRFPGCEEMAGDKHAKKACADKKLLDFVYQNIKYPAIAREMGIEGMAVVKFIVDKDGSISNIQIVSDPGGGCAREAARVVKLMNKLDKKWTPGKQRGKAGKVSYNLPVRFRLSD